MTCIKCGHEIPPHAGPGRPRRYCSTGCRRAMEYELRRLQRALENVEERQRWDRINRQENPALEQERRRVESRLRELLDDHQVGGL